MTRQNTAEFLLLAAVWGASFLFMRVAAPELGPVALVLMRCGVAAIALLAVLAFKGRLHGLRENAGKLFSVGVIQSAVPFVLFGYATLTLSAGITSIMNSLAPLWSAVIAFAWFGDRLTRAQMLGLALGCLGVAVLVAGAGHLAGPGLVEGGSVAEQLKPLVLPFFATIVATAAYGIAANYTRHQLQGVDPLVIATGSQVSATLVLLVPGLVLWPAAGTVSPASWWMVIALGVVCTAQAYLLFFRLIRSVGATSTIAVTFVIPVFGVLWGWWFLGELISLVSAAGAAIIVLGTALATGLLRPASISG